MKQLKIINQNGKLLTDSRDVADMTSTRHDHLLVKIDSYAKVLSTDPNFRVSDFFIESTYQDSTNRVVKCYLLTRKGCDMIANKMTGEKGILFTATYVTKFEEMEKQISAPSDIEKFLYNPDTILKIAQNWKEEQILRIAAEAKIEQDKPKTIFADAVSTSNDSILVGQLATILKQNGVNIGQTRLFNFLREEGYLCKSGERRNLPTQKAMELKLFEVKEFTVHGNSGIRVKNTPNVTGRGQIYFINKFLKHSA
jgi:anti-repressor protein